MRVPDSFLEELRARLPVIEVMQRHYKLKKSGSAEWVAIDDSSVGVNTVKNVWRDFGKGDKGGDIFDLEMFVTKCTFQEAIERLADMAGLPLPKGTGRTAARPKPKDSDGPLGPEPPPPEHSTPTTGQSSHKEITATYDYEDADGLLIYQVCRQEWIDEKDGRRKKTFLQRRPHGPIAEDRADQKWVWGLGAGVFLRSRRDGNFYAATPDRLKTWDNAERLEIKEPSPHSIYHLAQLREEMAQTEDERRPIFICEGEKDCNTLNEWGMVAITNSGGASNWRQDHAQELTDADVIIPLDNDQAGRKRGHDIAISLRGIARRVRVINWPEHWVACPDGGDITDWRDNGGDPDKLFAIIDQLKDWTPEPPQTNFNAIRFADIDKDQTPLQWTIKNILQRATVSLWYGPPGCGKSFLIIDAAMSIARGIPWMGRRCRPGLAIIQTGEGGVGFRNRLKAYRKKAQLEPGDDFPLVSLPVRINHFNDDADIDKLIAEIKGWAAYYEYPLELVVIDTFNAASGGANENANQDVGKVLDRCRKIVDATGAHVAVVHHTPAAGGKPRGHSSLVGDVETTIAVEVTDQVHEEERQDGSKATRTIKTWTLTKQKDAPSSISQSFLVKQVVLDTRDEDGEHDTSCIIYPLETAAAANKRVIPEGWAQIIPANDDIFRSLVRALNRHGRIPPPAAEVPPGIEAVTIKEWQDELIELSVGHVEITPTIRQRIKARIYRASKAWLPDRINLIAKKGDWVWRTHRRAYPIDTIPVGRVRQPEPEPLLAPGERIEDLPFDL